MRIYAIGLRALWTACLAFALHAAIGAPASAQSKMKAALLLEYGVNDAGFAQAGYLGLQAMKDLGFETTLVENLVSADQEAAARDFASKQYDIVFGHGFQFQSHFFRLAPDFPKTKFIVNKGAPKPETPDNLLIIDIKEHEPAYLLGVIAAHLTKTNTVGAIAGFDYGTIIRIMEAFRDGARSVNPQIKLLINYAGNWNDPVKGKELALAQIGQGADIVFAHASVTSLGVFEAAKDRGVLAFGSVLDQNSVAPETVVVGSLYDFPRMFLNIGRQVQKGAFKAGSVSYGMADGVLGITELHGAALKLDASIKEKIKSIGDDIRSGKLVVEDIRKKRG
jgi:basic membrane lipoprotein Med (substrate-binding protein (PBP1-ABC) superfamily)